MATPTLLKIRRFNLVMAALHFIQGVVILIISRSYLISITTTYLRFEQATFQLIPTTVELFKLSLPWMVAAFFFLSALAHLFIGTVYRKTYETNLQKGINKARWYEYSLSASIMMVGIASLVGIYDFASLLAIFALVAVMNLCGLVMEIHNQTTTKTNWLSFWIGCIAGIIPWIMVLASFWAAAANGTRPPTFVYWIYVTIFVLFNLFAVNMALQYKKVGKWKDYLYGERAYIILSLVAKSLLAWQLFAGTLRPL